jgi:hypothetical protein
VSTEGGRWPVWGPSGRKIYFADLENRLTVASVRGESDLEFGIPRALFEMPEQPTPFGAFDFANYAVTPDGQRFLFHHALDKGPISESLILVQNWYGILSAGPR